jgi:hypothetical protein
MPKLSLHQFQDNDSAWTWSMALSNVVPDKLVTRRIRMMIPCGTCDALPQSNAQFDNLHMKWKILNVKDSIEC